MGPELTRLTGLPGLPELTGLPRLTGLTELTGLAGLIQAGPQAACVGGHTRRAIFFLHTSAAKSHEISGLLSLVKRKGPACTQNQIHFCAPCKRSPELVTPDLARCSRWRLRGTPAPDAIVRTSGEPPIPADTLGTVRETIKSTLPLIATEKPAQERGSPC